MAIEITTPAQLRGMGQTGDYILMNDLDMSGSLFTPIGRNSSYPFRGTFDGNGYTISNLVLSKSEAYIGLFGYTNKATIQNVHLENVTVTTSTERQGNIGSLAGSIPYTTVKNCSVTGGHIKGAFAVGGMFGNISSSSIVEDCFADIAVEATNASMPRVGGFVGTSIYSAVVKNCYSYGNVISPTSDSTGGFIGYLSVSSSNKGDDHSNCYYNVEGYPVDGKTSMSDPVSFTTGLTPEQFADPSNFPTFDPTIWGFGEKPYLLILGEPEAPTPPARIETVEFATYIEPLQSYLERSRRKLINTITFTQSLGQDISKRLVERFTSWIDEIVSSIQVAENAKIKTVDLTSYVEAISSDSHRFVRASRVVDTSIGAIEILTDIQIPIDIEKPVYASIWVQKHQTNTLNLTNQSNSYKQENATETSVI